MGQLWLLLFRYDLCIRSKFMGIMVSSAMRVAIVVAMGQLCFVSSPALADSPQQIVVSGTSAPSLFGTATLLLGNSRYSTDWNRAQLTAFHHPRMLNLIAPARSLTPLQQVAYVQTAVHREIVWRSDATEWGRHDYWASASETLNRGAGDMEDRVILKMQALRALGFGASDLVLVMGRDKVAGPMTVLVVRLDQRDYVMLEDLGGAPIATDRRTGFEPILSFSGSNSWVHGRRVAQGTAFASANQVRR